jgi:pantoate--beta-alanine ligase
MTVRDQGLRVARSRSALVAALDGERGKRAVVMTMGALHDGHVALIREAHRHADHVVVSLFVNPLQFTAGEDPRRYPQSFEADRQRCADSNVAVVFAPSVEEMYPLGEPRVRVTAGALGSRWEGAARPGHFDGVLTVVLKLMNLIQPDVAVFGKKDAQQLIAVRAMVTDMDIPVGVIGVETVREPDGLALSSRNRLLNPDERRAAGALWRALTAGHTAAQDGVPAVLRAATEVLLTEPGIEVDYVAPVDCQQLEPLGDTATGPGLLLLAARIGGTRLIDNVALDDITFDTGA